MINSLVNSVVRRSFEAGTGETKIPLPTWAALSLGTTVVVFMFVMFMIEYTFGRLLPTLLMIESPQEAIGFEPLATEDPDSTIKDPEQQAVQASYITASFRRTIRHLHSIGGFRSRFRGLAMFIANAVAVNWVANMISLIPFVGYTGLASVIATVACAQLSLGWTHIVISEPSPKTWFRRIPSAKLWMKVAGPTAVLAVAEQLSVLLPLYLAMVTGVAGRTPKEMKELTPNERTAMAFKGMGIAAFGIILAFLVVIPANASLTRIQASTLDDSEETIVPFDRSFGGKVIPAIVGGTGVLSMLDAWKSFDWAARVRLVKAYVKVFAIQVAVMILFSLVVCAQLFAAVGTNWDKLIPGDGKGKEGL